MSVVGGILSPMDPIIFLIVGALLGVAAGFFIGKGRASGTPTEDVSELKTRLSITENTVVERQRHIDDLNVQLAQHLERERKDKEAESQVLIALKPVSEKIREMQEKVSDLEQERTEQFTTIKQQLTTQREAETRLRQTTEALANALTNNQKRGGWGEARLEEILVNAGLIKGIHYETQFESTNDDGDSIRPDVVVMLPEGKTVAVDSKTPYQAYLKAMEEDAKGIDANKDVIKQYMKEHNTAVRKKITELGTKNYWSGLNNSPEFTLMFIPNEPAIAATLDNDPSLMDFAFAHRVAIVSPVSFFSVLRTIAYTWRKSADEQTIEQIMDLGVAIYKELRIMGEKAVKLGGHLGSVVDDYNAFIGSLDGKFLDKAREINTAAFGRLGDKAIPVLKPIDESIKHLTKPELLEGDTPELGA